MEDLKYAVERSDADSKDDLIEYANSLHLSNPAHDAFVHGAGSAAELIENMLDEKLQQAQERVDELREKNISEFEAGNIEKKARMYEAKGAVQLLEDLKQKGGEPMSEQELPTVAALCKRTKNPGLDREKTVDDVVRLADNDTTLEGIADSVSYEVEENGELIRRSDVLDVIEDEIEIAHGSKENWVRQKRDVDKDSDEWQMLQYRIEQCKAVKNELETLKNRIKRDTEKKGGEE